MNYMSLGSLKSSKRGFTLTELLIVVAIMTIITTASIIGVINVSRRASTERAEKDIQDLVETFHTARVISGKALRYSTNYTCTECDCRTDTINQINNLNSACWVRYRTSIDGVNNATGDLINGYPTDPWGSPYMLDENEEERCCGRTDTNGDGRWCFRDRLLSLGANKVFGGGDDITVYITPECELD